MRKGMLHRLIDSFILIARELDVQCSCHDAEQIAVMVTRIMSYQSREFHTMDHVFGFMENADAHTALAAIFHDIVYYQVDDGLQGILEPIITRYVEERGGRVQIHTDIAERDQLAGMCMIIFGHKPGDELTPFNGLNEFLSALVFIHLFAPHLKARDIIAVLVCIEASIPFRKPSNDGSAVFDVLYQRTRNACTDYRAGIDDDKIKVMIHRAVEFANKDVEDFALDDAGQFLNGTWKLLPELNAALRFSGCYTISEYRSALTKMRKFFGFVAAENIYHSYDDIPSEAQMALLQQKSKKNLSIAREYLDAKILAIGILEAIASESGGDAPVSLFMGEIPRAGQHYEQLSDHLDWNSPICLAPPQQRDELEAVIFKLLRHGRQTEASFDLKNSPLALYVYERSNDLGRSQHYRLAEQYFAGTIPAKDFISSLGSALVQAILKALCYMVPTRLVEFNELALALNLQIS
jgi:hypothetical protein